MVSKLHILQKYDFSIPLTPISVCSKTFKNSIETKKVGGGGEGHVKNLKKMLLSFACCLTLFSSQIELTYEKVQNQSWTIGNEQRGCTNDPYNAIRNKQEIWENKPGRLETEYIKCTG